MTLVSSNGGQGSPGEDLIAELCCRPVDQLPTVLAAGVGGLVSPGGGDHKAEAQLGVEQG